jgi:ribose 5-phosphate isomerase A
MSADAFKRKAAERALTYVEEGMTIGLGTGSTAAHFVDLLGAKVAKGFDVRGVPTSEVTAAQAKKLGIPLTSLDDEPLIDLTVDGADECDHDLRLIKGGGAALLREKIVAAASARLLIIADHTKFVNTLGAFPLPIEVTKFGLASTKVLIETLSAEVECSGEVKLRVKDGKPVVTDGGNLILDCHFGRIPDPEALETLLKMMVPGVVETGLFLDMAWKVIIAGPDGIREIEADDDEI